MPRFKTVFFDVGGTLLHMGEPLAAYRDILAEHGYDVDATRVGEALGEARRVAAAVPSGPLPDGTILPERESLRRDAMVRALLERLGVGEDFEECRKAIWGSWLGTRVFHQFPEVRPVLTRLKHQGYALVAVSNWEPRLETLCANHGLREFFDFVLASEAEGYAKPGPFLFRKALQLTGAMPSEVIHVGDNYFEDVQAAVESDGKEFIPRSIDRGPIEAPARARSSLQSVMARRDKGVRVLALQWAYRKAGAIRKIPPVFLHFSCTGVSP